jgi:hypothetical protein
MAFFGLVRGNKAVPGVIIMLLSRRLSDQNQLASTDVEP